MTIESSTVKIESLVNLTTIEPRLSNVSSNETLCADQLIGEQLEGISGRIIWGIVQIFLMTLGNIGNLLTMIVLNHRLMRKGGVNNLLQGLAISDIIAPTIACIPHLMYYYGPRTNYDLITSVNAYVIPLATGATFSSNWIVVTITSFRLLIVVKPLYSQVYCSSRNERRSLLIITIFSILSILPYYYFHTDPDARHILIVISAIVSLLIPWLICVILWILLIRIVNREIGSKKSKQFILNSEMVAQRLKSKSKITRMVLIICFCNVICQLPVLILTIFGLFNSNPCGYILPIFFVCLLFISNLLLIVNHSINFCIYSLTNYKFRLALRRMCFNCFFFCNHRFHNQSSGSNYDDPRQTPIHQKYDANVSSYLRTRDSPRLILKLNHRENSKHYTTPITRVAR